MKKIAIYPGSFDPVTNGHLDIVERGLSIFDKIIVAILLNPSKESFFSVEERMEMLQISMKKFNESNLIYSTDSWWTMPTREKPMPFYGACGPCPTLNMSSRWP